MLLGLGTVGVAATGAGLGTSAYFNDTEQFANNVLTAGELDLLVDYYTYWNQGSHGAGSRIGTVDGTSVSGVLDDVKPGDSGLLAFCFEIVDNPAYLWTCGELTANHENGQSEPEMNESTDNTGGDPGALMGELAAAIEVDVNYCDIADNLDASGIDGFDPDDVTHVADVYEGTLAEFLALAQAGMPLDGSGTAGVQAPGEQTAFPGSAADPETDAPCLCIEWHVPSTVGNEIQTDSVAFDLEFYAEQARHNDGTHNPCADESFSAPYINDEDNSTQIDGTLKMDVNYGDQFAAYHVQMDDGNSGPKMSDPLNSVTNIWIPFDVDGDGVIDFQLQWFPGAGFADDPFGYKEVSGGSWGSTQALPAGMTAMSFAESIVFIVPLSMIDPDTDSAYTVGAHMSAGGEAPYAAISTQSATGEIVPSGQWTDASYLLDGTIQ